MCCSWRQQLVCSSITSLATWILRKCSPLNRTILELKSFYVPVFNMPIGHRVFSAIFVCWYSAYRQKNDCISQIRVRSTFSQSLTTDHDEAFLVMAVSLARLCLHDSAVYFFSPHRRLSSGHCGSTLTVASFTRIQLCQLPAADKYFQLRTSKQACVSCRTRKRTGWTLTLQKPSVARVFLAGILFLSLFFSLTTKKKPSKALFKSLISSVLFRTHRTSVTRLLKNVNVLFLFFFLSLFWRSMQRCL